MQNFEDLAVWQRAHSLTLAVYRYTECLPPEEKYELRRQMRRASVSIQANLAEGCVRKSDPDFARLAEIALGSASELRCLLRVSRDLGLQNTQNSAGLEHRISEVMRMLTGLVRRLRS